MISSTNSLKFGSSGILRMDLQLGYLSEVSSKDSLWVFYILGCIFLSNRRQVFRILNYRCSLLCSVLSEFSFIFSILVYSRRAINYAVQREFYCEAVLSG